MACGPQVLLSPATIFFLYLISQLSFLPLSLRLLSTGDQVPNKYPTIRKYLSSCYKNKLQNNTSRTILILLPLFAFFWSVKRLGLAIRCSETCQNAVLINQYLSASLRQFINNNYCNEVVFVVSIFYLVQQHPLFICFLSTTISASLFPSIPFLFQNQKTKKGVEIVPVAVKYWQTVSPRISMHLGLLLQRKWEPRLNSCCPLSNTSCEPTETNKQICSKCNRGVRTSYKVSG